MLYKIAPVRSDIANRRALAALLGLEAPGKIRGLQQPVLQIRAMDEVGLANFAVMNHLARLLDERIAAVIEGHGVYDAGVARRVGQRPRIFCVQRKRLVRDDVLSMAQRRHDHRHVQVVGRRVVDDVHVRIRGEGLVAGVRLGHTEGVGLRACRAIRARCDGHDIDEPEPPHRVDVVRSDEPGAHKAHPDPAHF